MTDGVGDGDTEVGADALLGAAGVVDAATGGPVDDDELQPLRTTTPASTARPATRFSVAAP
jgi:hypothetical protein